MVLNMVVDIDDFEPWCWILMVLKMVLEFDDFEDGAGFWWF